MIANREKLIRRTWKTLRLTLLNFLSKWSYLRLMIATNTSSSRKSLIWTRESDSSTSIPKITTSLKLLERNKYSNTM